MVLGLLGATGSFADEKVEKEGAKELKAQTICPVMGGKIDRKYYVDTEEGRIYLCCPGCIASVKKDPAKYIEKLKEEGVQLEKVSEKTDPKNNKEQKKETKD